MSLNSAFENQIKRRVFTLSGEIMDETSMEVVEQIIAINQKDEAILSSAIEPEIRPIHLYINSPGGYITAMLSLMSAISNSVTPVFTYCAGQACSAAFAIFLSGLKRYCYEYSYFMYHEISSWQHGKISTQEDQLQHAQILQKNYDDYVLARTKIKAKQLKDARDSRKEWHIYPDEAIKLGIADDIIQVKVKRKKNG